MDACIIVSFVIFFLLHPLYQRRQYLLLYLSAITYKIVINKEDTPSPPHFIYCIINQNRNYFFVANVMILFNLCWGYLNDIVLVFYPFGEQISDIYPFNPAILIYLKMDIKNRYELNYLIKSE